MVAQIAKDNLYLLSEYVARLLISSLSFDTHNSSDDRAKGFSQLLVAGMAICPHHPSGGYSNTVRCPPAPNPGGASLAEVPQNWGI